MDNMKFFNNKKVLVTGHTGFKGTWLCQILYKLGADVTGYSLESPTNPNLFTLLNMENKIKSIIGDIRDIEKLQKCFYETKPEIVIHLAAQPLVKESYLNPRYTYETNVMGTVNVLECIRNTDSVKSFLNVTTDKVYRNYEQEGYEYKEEDFLDGYDPYSNSKSCSELITHAYLRSYFTDSKVAISTARAGNVIGGGDFSKDRIIPDCIRAAENKEEIIIRNLSSIRPYQHVLESLMAYLMIVEKQYNDKKYSNYYNIGPDIQDCITTEQLVNLFCKYWQEGIKSKAILDKGPHEAKFLKLDTQKIKETFNWAPTWNIEKAVQKTVELAKLYKNETELETCINKQIDEFIDERGF